MKNLKDALEEKNLYCDSLENDFFTQEKAKSDDFREVCFEKRRLQRENEELLYIKSLLFWRDWTDYNIRKGAFPLEKLYIFLVEINK